MKQEACLIVADRGHVWVAQSAESDENNHWLHLHNARIVRDWGTSKGLNQLIDGPLAETVLDQTAPIVSVAMRAVIAVIPCRAEPWKKHLK